MKNYVQYHNSQKQGRGPLRRADHFEIFAKKSIRHLLGHRVWLISGEGDSPKRFYLEYTFLVQEVQSGDPNKAVATNGTLFSPRVPLTHLPWFVEFKKRQQMFRGGVQEIDCESLHELERLLEKTSGLEAETEVPGL